MDSTKRYEDVAALNLLDRVLNGASDCVLRYPLLISLDTEFSSRKFSELGISIFDPQNLHDICKNEEGLLLKRESIITQCFAKGGSSGRSNYKPYRFGEAQRFQNRDIPAIIQKAWSSLDTHNGPRDIAIVGHRIDSDLEEIRKFSGFDICTSPRVKAILDTMNISQYLFDLAQPRSLKFLLESLKLDYIGLHNAAHDSRYTLRALLMMYCTFRRASCGTETSQPDGEMTSTRLSVIERIARHHQIRPPRTWCYTSDRIKNSGNFNLFDEMDEKEDESGITALFC